MNTNSHLLVYPFPGPGHIIPILDFTNLLLRRGLTITIIISEPSLPLLEPLLSSHPSSLHKLVLSDPNHGSLPHPLIAKVNATQKQFEPIVQWFESHPSPPVAIVSDFFLGWTNELANHLGIRRVVFSPSGALGYSIFSILWRDASEIKALNGDGDEKENFVVSFADIPNSPRLPWWQLSLLWRIYEKGQPDFESFRKGMMANLSSWGVIFNTFEGLEGVYIDHMKKQMGHDRVWAVGPLLSDENGPISSTGRGGSSAVPPDDLFIWLDKKINDCVVYICFGSRVTLNETEMSALTDALELSEVNFILCTKESDSRFIPSGFEHRVGDRGFIVKGWAPQLAILRHRAVVSFVTHCGWNSTLEGVTTGVMMLTWPMGADQFANAKLLVDELGIGNRVCDGGPESVPDTVKLARLFKESVSRDWPHSVRVKEVSRAAIEAVKEGTSVRDLDRFIKLLSL